MWGPLPFGLGWPDGEAEAKSTAVLRLGAPVSRSLSSPAAGVGVLCGERVPRSLGEFVLPEVVRVTGLTA